MTPLELYTAALASRASVPSATRDYILHTMHNKQHVAAMVFEMLAGDDEQSIAYAETGRKTLADMARLIEEILDNSGAAAVKPLSGDDRDAPVK